MGPRSLVGAFLVTAALASGGPPARAQTTQEATAQVRYSKGRELYMAKKYAAALAELRGAVELYASPNTRLYIGRCERELGHPAAAFVELQRAATEAADRARTDPRYASTRDAAHQEAQAIEGQIGRLVVRAAGAQGVRITVAGAPLAAAALGVAAPFDPGTVEVTATAKGKLSFKKSVTVKAGQTTELTIALEPDPAALAPTPPDGPLAPTSNPDATDTPPQPAPANLVVERSGGGARVVGFVVGGAGLAGVATFAVFAAIAQSQYDQLRRDCSNAPCGPSYGGRISDGERNQNIGNVTLGLGIGALLVGGILIAAGGPKTVVRPAAAALVPFAGPLDRGLFFGVRRAF